MVDVNLNEKTLVRVLWCMYTLYTFNFYNRLTTYYWLMNLNIYKQIIFFSKSVNKIKVMQQEVVRTYIKYIENIYNQYRFLK